MIWFRLPSRGDRRAIAIEGLAALTRGETPEPRPVALATRHEDGAFAISVSNSGSVPTPPGIWDITFRRGALDAFDVTGSLAAPADQRVSFTVAALPPHHSRAIGWVRLSGAEDTIDVHAR